ncbi:MAG: hypothetical protein QOI07_353 [Verrucomicrobiota bacterium]|jgi:hypothetical protein
MKGKILIGLVALLALAAPSGEARGINDIPAAKEALLRIVSQKFYRSLAISPVQGWIVVRGNLVDNHVVGARVVRSELNGRYDALALELARNLQVVDLTRVDTSNTGRPVLVHLLIYQIADGTMAMSFAHLEGAGGNQFRYSGAAWMAVLKGDKWVTIEPHRLTPNEGRGPRMYTLAVEPPASARSLQGNGRPPITIMSIQGAGVSSNHSIKDR